MIDTNLYFMFSGAFAIFMGMILTMFSNRIGFEYMRHVPMFMISFGLPAFLNGLTMDALMNGASNPTVTTIVLCILQVPVLIWTIYSLWKMVRQHQVWTASQKA